MAGFLDNTERVIDMVLTGAGKKLLMKGDLRFVYWIPFDDEADYQVKVEDPLVREACSGYPSNNKNAEDRVNVNQPLFTAPNRSVLPTMDVDISGSSVKVKQQPYTKTYVKYDGDGKELTKVGPVPDGVDRTNILSALVDAKYETGSFPPDHTLEGFLVTMYVSSSDGLVEIFHNRDSAGDLVYRNDLKLKLEE
jgi:hypothetical protein